MSIKAISILAIEDIRIIKKITIVSKFGNNNEYSIGYILYEREFSDSYKFKETPEEEKDFLYYLEYPRQDSYPNDSLDDLFLQSVKNDFPNSITRNYSLISNVDKEHIQLLQNRQYEKSQISMTPDFSQIDTSKLVGQNFNVLRIPIKIYNDFTKEKIKNLAFFGYYNLKDEQILERIDKINFI